jgi:glycosyltransferase involved in cell wall biosynthesis
MANILFDHQKFSTQHYGGISRYFANIVQRMTSDSEFKYKIGCLYSPNHYIKDEPQLLNNALGKALLTSKYGGKTYTVNKKYCEYLIRQDNFDIFHPTYYDPYFIGKVKKPTVVTIHDMTHERLPEYFWSEDDLTRNKRLNIEIADKIIAISETTKRDLIAYSNVDPQKIEVIYHGIDLDIPLDFEEVPNITKRYFLYVGDRSGYKNFYRFLDAFHRLSLEEPDIEMILTGGGEIALADRELIHRLKLDTKVKHLNVSDAQLNYLYNNAVAFVYPSLHEGFGLPVLEAFKADCPVLLSDTECFREIGAQAVAYFDAYDYTSLLALMKKVLADQSYRQSLIQGGKERLKDFPLDKSIQETFDLYRSLL